MTEAWFRNPHNYIRELVEAGEYHVAWDRGLLYKNRIDPIKHAATYFGQAFPWRILAVGDQGTAEYRNGDEIFAPTAVYPTFKYGDDPAILEELLSSPIGEDESLCNDTKLPGDERPVFGQENRIIITDIPNAMSGPGRQFIAFLKTMQEDYPEAILHIHGLYSYRIGFGMGFGAADTEPRTTASKGKVFLPSGKIVTFEHLQAKPQWATTLGFKPIELAEPRMRCIFNIKSAVWAAAHFDQIANMRLVNDGTPTDTTTPDSAFQMTEGGRELSVTVKPKEGDKFNCDTCSLSSDCKHAREGSICTLPGAETKPLYKMFSSRDANQIIDGLGALMERNTRRLQQGLKDEEDFGELVPEVTKVMGQVFDQGTKLAKLIDPTLNGGAKVQVNVGGAQQVGVQSDPRQIVASIFKELEASGIPREEITPDMVKNVLAQRAPQDAMSSMGQKVIEQ